MRLTAQGRRRLDDALPAMRHVDRALLAAIPAANRSLFRALLVSLAEAADKLHAENEALPPPKKAPARKPAAPLAAKARKKARAKR